MKSYNYFAEIYDDLTFNVDYKVRSDYISGFFNEYGLAKNSYIIDLACGTGSMSLELIKKGYKIVGIDASEQMLSVADSKLNGKAELINAEMQNFILADKADAAVCLLDSINHLENISVVENCFKCVYNSLREKGLFIFDVNTIYKHNKILADNTFVFDEENYFLSWDNELLQDNKVRILLDIFFYNGKSYDRYSEEFTETAYSIDSLLCALKPYFNVLGIFDELTRNKPNSSSERLYFVCERK